MAYTADDNMDSYNVPDEITKLLIRKASQPNALILAVASANGGDIQSQAIFANVLRKADLKLERTLGVLTHMDALGGSYGQKAYRQNVLKNKTVRTRYGWIGLSNLNMRPGLEHHQMEQENFQAQDIPKRYCGVATLREKLNQKFKEVIDQSWPRMIHNFEQNQATYEHILKLLGPLGTDDRDYLKKIM